jgi:LIVCS family branched-chain amino acid:cation transporter
MALLGPFGAAPRCIAIAYADLSWYLPGLNVALFSILISLVIWICAYKHSNVMTILGCYLGPIKIICLLLILLIGLLSPSIEEPIKVTQNAQIFWQGFLSGFGTMDLLAIIFFSQLVYQSLAVKNMTTNYLSVAAVAGILLTIIYIGFAAVAALHSQKIGSIADDTMLSALASMLLGGRAGIFVNISIGLTCLTTAIALTSTFADFLSRDILRNKISYNMALSISIIISAIMANLGFTGIMKFVLPWLSICYPALMFFAVLYIASCTGLIKTSYARIGFFLVLIVSCIFNY